MTYTDSRVQAFNVELARRTAAAVDGIESAAMRRIFAAAVLRGMAREGWHEAAEILDRDR